MKKINIKKERMKLSTATHKMRKAKYSRVCELVWADECLNTLKALAGVTVTADDGGSTPFHTYQIMSFSHLLAMFIPFSACSAWCLANCRYAVATRTLRHELRCYLQITDWYSVRLLLLLLFVRLQHSRDIWMRSISIQRINIYRVPASSAYCYRIFDIPASLE